MGPGFRVPCIIVSPWTTGGYVCSDPFDHTSVLRFLEHVTGVVETNISTYRRQTFGDLTSAFRFQSSAPPPTLPDTTAQLALAQYEVASFPRPAFPGADQTPPFQLPGRRPHVPRKSVCRRPKTARSAASVSEWVRFVVSGTTKRTQTGEHQRSRCAPHSSSPFSALA